MEDREGAVRVGSGSKQTGAANPARSVAKAAATMWYNSLVSAAGEGRARGKVV